MKNITFLRTFITGFDPRNGGMSWEERSNKYKTWKVLNSFWTGFSMMILILLSPIIAVFVGLMFTLGILGEIMGIRQEEH